MEGAQQFVSYWLGQFNVAFEEAEPAPVQILSSDACPACRGYIAEINNLAAQQRHAQGDLWTATSIIVEQFDGGASAVVFATVRQNAIAIVDRTGVVVDRYKERTDDLGFTLTRAENAWRVTRVQVAK